MDEDERGYAPIPGESKLFLVTSIVVLACVAIPFVIVVVMVFFNPDLGPTLGWLTPVLLFCVALFLTSWLQRRAYLRDVRNGKVQVREPWEPDVPYSG